MFVPRRFPYLPSKGHRDSDYSAATAVRLLLQFQIEISVVFLLMALLCIGTVTDNVNRSYIRASCRRAASTPTGYIALTLGQSGAVPEEMVCSIERTSPLRHTRSDYWYHSVRSTPHLCCVRVHSPGRVAVSQINSTRAQLGFEPSDCGWSYLPIRAFAPDTIESYQPSWPYLLRTSIGGCQEYTDFDTYGAVPTSRSSEAIDAMLALLRNHTLNHARHTLYSDCMLPRGPLARDQCEHLFVDTPNAAYCISASETSDLSTGMQLAATVLFVLYLVRLRWTVCKMEREEDTAIISTADYALQISGLDRKLEADDLLVKLKEELEGLEDEHGSFADTIHHVEVGRHCENEITVLNQMHRMDVRAEEITERMRLRQQLGQSTEAVEKQLTALAEEYVTVKERMVKLVEEPDMATGHAFVVFNYERDRNRCARLFAPMPRSLYSFLHPVKRKRQQVPMLKCAAAKQEGISASKMSQMCRCVPHRESNPSTSSLPTRLSLTAPSGSARAPPVRSSGVRACSAAAPPCSSRTWSSRARPSRARCSGRIFSWMTSMNHGLSW